MNSTVSRRSFIKAAAASSAAIIGRAPPFRPRISQPNIILILADDLRFDAVGYRNKQIITPNLDSLAQEGLRFQNAFVTTSICAISRASIFTGMYARRHRICDFLTPLSPELVGYSYPVLLRDAGYRTGFFGKYGVGDMRIGESGGVLDAQLPDLARAGFDAIEDYGFAYHLRRGTRGEEHVHDILAKRAEDFIYATNPKQPFCLSLSFVSPHERRPLPGYDVSENVMSADLALPAEPDLLALYEKEIFAGGPLLNETSFRSLPGYVRNSLARRRWLKLLSNPINRHDYLRRYYALVTGLDRVIGRVRRAVEQGGAISNTAWIFTSDNGLFLGDYHLHEKWFGYEPSIRVPLMIRLPGRAMSLEITEPALNIDLAPTMLALAGAAIPTAMQGQDLATLWTSRRKAWRTDFLYEHFLCNRLGQLDPQTERRIPSSEGVRDQRYTYLRYPYQKEDSEVLFDRVADPNQIKNIIHSAPLSLVERFRKRTDEMIALYS